MKEPSPKQLRLKAAAAAILTRPDEERNRVRALLDGNKWNIEMTIDAEGWITLKIVSATLRIHKNAVGEGADFTGLPGSDPNG